jgi:uncharacterized membrane protein
MDGFRGRARTWWRAASGADDDPLRGAPIARAAIAALIAGAASLFATLALLRWQTFHNDTFDLAFYARIAWGQVHVDGWEPIVGAPVFGLHLSWILAPLGVLGAIFGQAPTLLVAQSVALAGAAWPIARLGARHLGAAGGVVAALAWLLHPNVAEVAANEFHPGSVAALPLAWAAESLDRRSAQGLALGVLGALACREDLGLVTMLLGAGALILGRGGLRGTPPGALTRTGRVVLLGSALYVLFFVLVLHPLLAPPRGSLELHFGRYGSSVVEVALHLLTHPADLAGHLSISHRLLYLPTVCAPLALLPFLRPGYALFAAPVLAINLVSEFPGTTDLDSHYLTPALPLIVASAIHGAAALPASPLPRLAPLALASLLAHAAAGGTPFSTSFRADDYTDDPNARAARRILEHVDADASIQAPDPILPHVAERRMLHRPPPPEQRTRFVVLDAAHRRRFLHREDLLRTSEEPIVRAWLSRGDHALVEAAGDYLLLERDRDPRDGIGARAIVGQADPEAGARLASCLGLLGAHVERGELGEPVLALDLVARSACPDDLALRIGRSWRPRRVDLVADGLLSPAHFRRGDRIRSVHALDPADTGPGALRIGALRSSGARPEHGDPTSIPLDLREAL